MLNRLSIFFFFLFPIIFKTLNPLFEQISEVLKEYEDWKKKTSLSYWFNYLKWWIFIIYTCCSLSNWSKDLSLCLERQIERENLSERDPLVASTKKFLYLREHWTNSRHFYHIRLIWSFHSQTWVNIIPYSILKLTPCLDITTT